MAKSRSKKRSSSSRRTERRPVKKRVCVFCSENIDWVDYKDAEMLRRFISDRAKIRARRVSGNCRLHQAEVARAVKLARELALLPYAQRQVTVRSKKRGGRDSGPRASGPPPSPSAPPPPPKAGGPEDEGEGESTGDTEPTETAEASAEAEAPEESTDTTESTEPTTPESTESGETGGEASEAAAESGETGGDEEASS